MKIAVRLDDINPCMDFEKFNKVKNMLDKYNVCPLIGVVPDNHDDRIAPGEMIKEYSQLLVKLKKDGWIIGMHGVTHCYLDIENNRSEFCGLTYEKQYKLLKMGKELLEHQIGDRISVFFAPSNNHDDNTVAALKDLGFTHISYGKNDNVFGDDMTYIPIASGIRQVTRLLWFQKNRNGITTLVIHPNTTSDRLLERYDRLLSSAYKKGFLINYGEALSEKTHIINEKWIRSQEIVNVIEGRVSRLKKSVVQKRNEDKKCGETYKMLL